MNPKDSPTSKKPDLDPGEEFDFVFESPTSTTPSPEEVKRLFDIIEGNDFHTSTPPSSDDFDFVFEPNLSNVFTDVLRSSDWTDHYLQGEDHFKNGRETEAIAAFEQANKVKETWQSHYYIGMCYMQLNDLDRAKSAFGTAVENGSIVKARVKLAELHSLTGDKLEAVTTLYKIYQIAKEFPEDITDNLTHETFYRIGLELYKFYIDSKKNDESLAKNMLYRARNCLEYGKTLGAPSDAPINKLLLKTFIATGEREKAEQLRKELEND